MPPDETTLTLLVPFEILDVLVSTPVNNEPLPIKYAALTLPVTFAVPEILAPVPVTVNVVLPTAVISTFPFATGILTLLLPFDNEELVVILTQLKLPVPSVCNT